MEEKLAEVLAQIEAGETRFEPKSASDADLNSFQATGQALEEADERGYIEAIVRKSRCRENWGLILWVEVTGPVSYRGKMFLEHRESTPNNEECPWILEPNIHGFGVRLPQLWRRLKAKFRK